MVRFPCGLVTEALAQQQQRRGGMADPGPFTPIDGANNPVGVSKAIHPGRVAWVRDAKAATWDTQTGKWWDDANTDQRAVDRMTSRLLLDVTGQKNEKQAWDALFRSFNETHKTGGKGYKPGEVIAIKINANQDRGPDWANMQRPSFGPPPGARPGGGAPPAGGPPPGAIPRMPSGPLNGLPSPHAVMALVSQLINVAGVRGEDILIYDACGQRNVGQPIYSRIRANSNKNFQAVKFLSGDDYGHGDRMRPIQDKENPLFFSSSEVPTGYIPQQVVQAKYMINMALLRAHGMAGVTLIGKNHFGSVFFPEGGGWSPRTLHDFVLRSRPMASYNALVDLMGHRHLGGKTMLYMLDGLYTAQNNEGNVYKWQTFGDQWAASIMMSQDPVALDSVGLDALHAEQRAVDVRGTPDNYLHEAAQASKPPSGTVYNPDKSGVLASLGVNEHWNNPTDRKYSRNLGRKEGIELIASV